MTRTREERPDPPQVFLCLRKWKDPFLFIGFSFFTMQDLLRFYKFSLVILIANKIGTNFSIFLSIPKWEIRACRILKMVLWKPVGVCSFWVADFLPLFSPAHTYTHKELKYQNLETQNVIGQKGVGNVEDVLFSLRLVYLILLSHESCIFCL